MRNFALIENGTVANVAVVPANEAHRGAEYMADDLGLGGLWVESGGASIGWLYENGVLMPPVAPELDLTTADDMRVERDRLLQELDAVVSNPLRWGTFTEAEQQELSLYRQALLDVPQQEGFPQEAVFPTVPKLLGG